MKKIVMAATLCLLAALAFMAHGIVSSVEEGKTAQRWAKVASDSEAVAQRLFLWETSDKEVDQLLGKYPKAHGQYLSVSLSHWLRADHPVEMKVSTLCRLYLHKFMEPGDFIAWYNELQRTEDLSVLAGQTNAELDQAISLTKSNYPPKTSWAKEITMPSEYLPRS